MPVVTALSVSEQITNVGAYAGLASILGLAVLSLLYFGQARELKRLRDWAGRAPERTVELQEQADQAAAAAAQRRPAPATPQVAGTPRTPAAVPAAASTTVRPVPATQAATAAGAATAATAAGAAKASAPAGTPAAETPAAAGTGAATPGEGPVAWAPSPGAPTAGVGEDTQAIPAVPPGAPLPEPVPSVAAPAPIGPEAPPTGDNPVPLRQVSAAAGTGLPRRRATPEPVSPAEPAGRSRGDGRPGGRRIGALAGGAALLLLVVVLATQVLGGDDEPARTAGTETGNTIVPPSSTSTTATAPTVTPADFQVFVLNGTTQNGIAAEFAKTLETAGYVSAGTGNAAVNTETTTTVFFAEGKKAGASAVARELGVKTANVKAADAGVTASGKGADVIVQIGADKATP